MPWLVDAAVPGPEALLAAIEAALGGTGPALAPTAGPPEPLPERVAEDTCLAIRTSGSTGSPRRVLLGAAALRASAHRTHERLGGAGRWVLALPLDHVAGLQVLVRSIVAGTDPLLSGGSPEALAASVAAAAGTGPLYTALVPTQLHRIVRAATTSPDGALPPELTPLLRFDAILVGGSAASPALLEDARRLGLRVVTTYGMTETAGGCVYDGLPLDDVEVGLDDGVIRIAGPVLASGYLVEGRLSTDGFERGADGALWFRTADLGRLRGGRLEVVGRHDDVIVTGGVNVAPTAVEGALSGVPGVAEVCVVGVQDAEWGQRVTAVVVPGPGPAPTLAALREAVSRTLGSASAPRALVLVDALPLRGPGKVDRAAVRRRAAGS